MSNAFFWNVRREVWEHRSVWMAPLAIAVLVLVAFAIGASGHLEVTGFRNIPADKKLVLVAAPFSIAALAVMVTAFVIAGFYSLDALNAERKDRSILFWKSMPVSDATAVVSKAVVAIVVIPLVALVVALVMQVILFAIAAIVLNVKGIEAGPLFQMLPAGTLAATFIYGAIVHALWYAPVFALFLVASVATRRPLLWVIIPAVVVQVLEKVAFNTGYVGEFIKYRLLGAASEAFKTARGSFNPTMEAIDAARFFSSWGLWLGLAAAAVLLFIAIRIRRRQEPLS